MSTDLAALAMASGCPCSSTIKDLTAFRTSLSDCSVAMTTDLSLSFVITVIKVGIAVPSIRCTKDENEAWHHTGLLPQPEKLKLRDGTFYNSQLYSPKCKSVLLWPSYGMLWSQQKTLQSFIKPKVAIDKIDNNLM